MVLKLALIPLLGAGTLIPKNKMMIPSNCILTGNPFKIIKKNIGLDDLNIIEKHQLIILNMGISDLKNIIFLQNYFLSKKVELSWLFEFVDTKNSCFFELFF